MDGLGAGQGLPAAMGGVGTIFNVIGNLSAGSAARAAGQRAQDASNFEAAQLRQQAGQSVAASQRDAMEQRRRAQLIASRAVAVAAASGGSVSDPTVANLIADIEGEGALRAGLALYQGEERARTLRTGADAKVYEGELMAQGGKDRQRAYQLAGFGGLATGAASLYTKYGKGGPKAGSDPGFASPDGLESGESGGYYSADEYPYAYQKPSRV